MTSVNLIPMTAQLAADIHTGRHHPTWAEDFPSEGDLVTAGIVCRRIAAGAEYQPPSDDYPWSYYLITADDVVVGGCGFKSAPDELGQVEIGYGLAASHQGRGIATDAVRALVDIAMRAGTAVIAETEDWNVASIRVLAKLGFTRWDRPDETHMWWRLPANQPHL